ncbi:hypothetical protein BRC94_13450 [Halobacteriales archaeon QS_5_70_17]|nr:MAG: hypothetical protein BRC94_13450 [Halobacteriales archaeon QS_5_70_17]
MGHLSDSLLEALSVFEDPPSGRPLTTDEVADRLDLDRRTAAERLERLVDRDVLGTRAVGTDDRVWWRRTDDSVVTLTVDLDSAVSDPRSGTEGRRAGANTIPADEILDTAEVGVFVLDAAFDVVWANAAIERYFGLDRAEAIHRDKRQLVDDRIAPTVENPSTFTERVLSTYEDNSYSEQFECRVTAGDGREDRWLEHRSTPIEDGPYAGGRIEVYYDITDRKHAHDEARLLSAASRSIAEAETLEDGFQATLADVCEWTDWEVGQAWVPTPTEESEEVVERLPASYVTDEAFAPFEHASRDYTFGPGDGILGQVLETAEPVWFPDISAVSESVYLRTELAAEVGLKAGLGVPVLADGEVAVVLEFYMAQRHKKTDRLVETVTSVAAKLGNLVGRRRKEDAYRREAELTDRIFETSPVGIAVFDADRQLERANERLAELFDATLEEYTPGDQPFFDADGEPLPFEERPVSRVHRTGDPVSELEVQVRTSPGRRRWLSINATPITDEGESVRIVATVTDVTRLKEQTRRLEQRRAKLEAELDEVFDRIDDAFYAIDDDWRFTYVNDRAEDLLGYAESELLDRNIWEVLGVPATDPVRETVEMAMDTQHPRRIEEFFDPLDRWVELRIHPSDSGLSVYMTDIADRKERERRLDFRTALLEAQADATIDGHLLVEEDRTIAYYNQRFAEIWDIPEKVLAERSSERALQYVLDEVADPDEFRRKVEALYDDPDAESRDEIKLADGRWLDRYSAPVTGENGTYYGRLWVFRDITDRKERERFLEDAKAQLEAATEAGAIGTWEWHVPDDEMVVGPSFARTFGVDPEAAREGVSLEKFLSAIHPDDRERVEAKIEAAVESCGEYEAEYRVRDADGELRWVVARGHVECDDGEPITFPGALVDITERKRAESELEQQRRRLAALNDLNGVVRGITDAAIEESTREEIEAVVCERLAATDSYSLAWIGEQDIHSRTVSVRAESGAESYLEEIEISLDPADERSEGPTARAFRTGDVQTVQNVQTDPNYEPWRETAERYGIRSSAAIPIAHGEAVYGVLNVYADRPRAFEGEELRVLGHLGEIVGHAIAAAERKRALMSDEVVEVEFLVPDVFETLGADGSTDGRITLNEIVPQGDDDYLVYGTATAEAVDSVPALVDAVPHWTAVSFMDDRAEDGTEEDPEIERRFELRLSEPPVLSAVAARGGSIERATIDNGNYRLGIHLPPSVDVREITDVIEDTYPAADMVLLLGVLQLAAGQHRRGDRGVAGRLLADGPQAPPEGPAEGLRRGPLETDRLTADPDRRVPVPGDRDPFVADGRGAGVVGPEESREHPVVSGDPVSSRAAGGRTRDVGDRGSVRFYPGERNDGARWTEPSITP